MTKSFYRVLCGLVAGAAVALATPAAFAEDFYKGKSIRIIVGSAAGDGYDTIARTVMRYMPKHIPGNPNVVVMNMPGAGGVVAANHLANIAEKDGTVIGMANRFAPMTAALGTAQTKFKGSDFHWLGTTASYKDNSYLLVIRSALPHRTAQDLRTTDNPIAIAESGTDVPAILKEALGFKIKLIAGYVGSGDLELAFERGEVDGHTSGYASILQRHQRWIDSNFIRPMVQFGRVDRLPALADVPTARELAQTAADRALIEFSELPLLMARPFMAPPGVPADRVEILRTAFMKTMADPEYIADGTRQKHELTPANGADLQKIVQSMSDAPATVVQRYLKAVGGKVPK